MTSPFGLWLDLWESSARSMTAGFRFAEMMQASGEVVRSRSATIGEAMRDPLNGDYRELGLMVPEKVEAFSGAVHSIFGDVAAIQASAQANWSQAASLMMSGRAPTLAEAGAMWTRSGQALNRSIAMAGKALVPVHGAATANARRLRKKKTR
jgi:hypothetical protein